MHVRTGPPTTYEGPPGPGNKTLLVVSPVPTVVIVPLNLSSRSLPLFLYSSFAHRLLSPYPPLLLEYCILSHRPARRLRCSLFSSNFFRYCLESSRHSPVPFPIAQALPPAADFEKSLTSLSAGWTGAEYIVFFRS